VTLHASGGTSGSFAKGGCFFSLVEGEKKRAQRGWPHKDQKNFYSGACSLSKSPMTSKGNEGNGSVGKRGEKFRTPERKTPPFGKKKGTRRQVKRIPRPETCKYKRARLALGEVCAGEKSSSL